MNIDIFCNLCNEKNIIETTIIEKEINTIKNNKNNELKNKNENKNVSFHTTVKVILIPDRNEEKYNKFISRFEDSVQIEK